MAVTSLFQVLRRLSKDSLIYGLGRLLPRASAIVLVPIYTAYLVPADYGILSLAAMIAAMIVQVMLLGQTGTLVRFHRRAEREHSEAELGQLVFTVTLFVLLIGGALLGALLLIGPWLLPKIVSSKEFTFHPYLTVALVTTYAVIPMTLLQALYRAEGQSGRHIAFQLARFVISTAFALYFVVALGQGALGSLKGGLYSGLILLPVAGYLLIRRMRPRFSFPLYRQALTFGLPLVPHFFAGWVLTFSDRYILELYTSLDQVGFYSLAYNVSLVMSMIAGSANMALAPIYYDLMATDEGRAAVPRVTTLFVAGATLVAVCILLFSRELLLILAASRYEVAGGVVPILVAGYYLQAIYFVLSKPILYVKRTRLLPMLSGGAALLNIGLNLVLIPRYGMYAAAWTTVAAFGVMAIGARIVSGRLVPGSFQDLNLLKIVGLFSAAFVANQLAIGASWSLLPTLAAKAGLLVLLGAGFFGLRVITPAELRALVDRLRGRTPKPGTTGDDAPADLDGSPPVQ